MTRANKIARLTGNAYHLFGNIQDSLSYQLFWKNPRGSTAQDSGAKADKNQSALSNPQAGQRITPLYHRAYHQPDTCIPARDVLVWPPAGRREKCRHVLASYMAGLDRCSCHHPSRRRGNRALYLDHVHAPDSPWIKRVPRLMLKSCALAPTNAY